jgi:hypothetical protein
MSAYSHNWTLVDIMNPLDSLSPRDVGFDGDGTTLFIQDNTDIYSYDLSSPYDIMTDSNKTLVLECDTLTGEATCWGFDFSTDGLTLFLNAFSADTLFSYTLSAPWDLSSPTLLGSFYYGATNSNARTMVIRSDLRKIWLTQYGDHYITEWDY